MEEEQKRGKKRERNENVGYNLSVTFGTERKMQIKGGINKISMLELTYLICLYFIK